MASKGKSKDDDSKQENMFSRLTNDLLCEVISRLNSRDAIRTSLLSRSWKNLWKEASFKNIYFEARDEEEDKTLHRARKFSDFLKSRKVTEVESMTIICHLKHNLRNRMIEAWVRFAVNNKVQRLNLNFSLADPKCRYVISPKSLHDDIKHLTLSSIYIHNDSLYYWDRFKSLVSLTLKHTCVDFNSFRGIFAMCSSLESLTIEDCVRLKCFEYITNQLNINGSLVPLVKPLRLKHLSIINCDGLTRLNISGARCLESFSFAGYGLDELVCGYNIKTVKKVSFHVSNYNPMHLYRIDNAYPCLETLSLHQPITQESEYFPTLTSIKNLKLRLDHQHTANLWSQISNILNASPSLNKFELHLPRLNETYRWLKKTTSLEDHQHNNLKEVVIYNFCVEARNVELLKKIINCANFLEKIIIHMEPHQTDFSFTDLAQTLSPTVKLQVV